MINGYVAAGYGLIWVSLSWFAWRTHLRVRSAERTLAETKTQTENLESERDR